MLTENRIKELTLAICTLFAERGASNLAGMGACAAVFCVSMIDSEQSKERALSVISETWDVIAREREKLAPRGEDFTFVFAPGAQAMLDDDPEAAAAMKEMQARMREALDGVATGRFADVDEAFRSIGAVKVGELDDDDD